MTAELWAADEVAQAPAFQPGNLTTKFLEPPFTVLDTRGGRWQDRRRAWLSLGIRSELGRGASLVSDGGLAAAGGARKTYASNGLVQGGRGEGLAEAWARERIKPRGALPVTGSAGEWSQEHTQAGEGGTSIFDPVLCELAYRWWAPEGGAILDPFAGGSVRGIVAAKLGHPYTGIDLSLAQLEANREQARAILTEGEPMPTWLHGDSAHLDELLPAGELYDMVWSCPPYFDLEVYSDEPADLSTMDWAGFLEAYGRIVAAAVHRLRPERFAAFVVSEVRDSAGAYRGLVPATIEAFVAAGARYYNEAILVNSAGSLPLRVTRYMEASRKLGRAHQNVLCFLKGDPPRGWSYDRAAPPSPQLALELEVPEAPPEESAPSHAPQGHAAEADLPVAPVPTAALESRQRASELVNEPEAALTRCEDHEPGYHATEAEADECSAETYGEAGWPVPELEPTEDGRLADPATGELYLAEGVPAPHLEPAPDVSRWLAERATLWDATDPQRRCWSCGAEPTDTFRDGSPRYSCSHATPATQPGIFEEGML